MMGRDRDRGWTRADVLVVVALGVFLLAVVAPLASKPRERASRVLCKANLGTIGKAMRVYAGDYDGQLPKAGGSTSAWGPVVWDASDRYVAFGISSSGDGGRATISSCFYLLVKYLEMPTRLFVCPGDRGASEFTLADENVPPTFELIDVWDFGSMPQVGCSYAYHMPFGVYALSTASDPNLAVAADRNPWIKGPATDPSNFSVFIPDLPGYLGTVETARGGNVISHQRDGQNVLFLDGRVTFEHRAFCGIDDDNIYTKSTIPGKGDPMGCMPSPSPADQPANRKDSLLLHDPGPYGSPPRRR